MTIGQWLGKIAGQWLGSTGEVDLNAMYGSASFSITTTATLTNGASITPADMVGSTSFSITTSGNLTESEVTSYGRSSVRLRAIVDKAVVVKGSKLVVSVTSAIPRAAVQELVINSIAIARAVRVDLKTSTTKAVAKETAVVNALGTLLRYAIGVIGAKANANPAAKNTHVTISSGTATATTNGKRSIYGKKVRLKAGTLDDVWSTDNPSDEELAMIAYMLTC